MGRRAGFVAIGWEELGDLTWLTDAQDSPAHLYKRLTELYRQTFGGSNIAVGLNAAMIWNFVREISVGDVVLVPDSERRTVLPGRVKSEYRYAPAPDDDCPYPHRRDIAWQEDKEFRTDDLPPKLKSSLSRPPTVFNLDAYAEELAPRVGFGPKYVTGEQLVRLLVVRIHDSLTPEEFERFVSDVLGTTGFEATTTRYVVDKGIDVIGVLNAEGIAQVRLQVQVKRLRGRVGAGEVQRIRGALDVDSQGAIVSLGGFTKQAQAEAESEQRKTIALIDGEALVDLFLRHWDELEPKYGARFGIKKRDIPRFEQFWITVE
jgi:predicted Mrr-cat superfamily restriction endonuclease